jgi:hypothetical protein
MFMFTLINTSFGNDKITFSLGKMETSRAIALFTRARIAEKSTGCKMCASYLLTSVVRNVAYFDNCLASYAQG